MNQIGDGPNGETRYRAADGVVYRIVKQHTPALKTERWHWFEEEGGRIRKDACGHATENACIDDLIKFGRLTGRV